MNVKHYIESYEKDITAYCAEMIAYEACTGSKVIYVNAYSLYNTPGNELAEEEYEQAEPITMEDLLIRAEETLKIANVKKAVIKHILNERIMRCLKAMNAYLTQASGRIKQLYSTIFRSIFLLFGMCASRPAYIYAAIFGSSSTRIFS